MIQLQKGLLIAVIFISSNICGQNLMDSTTVSQAIRLVHDYEKCIELNDSLERRLDIYIEYKKSAEETIEAADSLNVSCANAVASLNEENVELTEENEKLKKNRRWWFAFGAAIGGGVVYFISRII